MSSWYLSYLRSSPSLQYAYLNSDDMSSWYLSYLIPDPIRSPGKLVFIKIHPSAIFLLTNPFLWEGSLSQPWSNLFLRDTCLKPNSIRLSGFHCPNPDPIHSSGRDPCLNPDPIHLFRILVWNLIQSVPPGSIVLTLIQSVPLGGILVSTLTQSIPPVFIALTLLQSVP